jgi:proline iminopeptidase
MYYFINHCFLPENYILDNVAKLGTIPTYIVQGAKDQVCPKNQALLLAQHLNQVELYLDPTGGHSNNENMTKQLKLMVQKARLK